MISEVHQHSPAFMGKHSVPNSAFALAVVVLGRSEGFSVLWVRRTHPGLEMTSWPVCSTSVVLLYLCLLVPLGFSLSCQEFLLPFLADLLPAAPPFLISYGNQVTKFVRKQD